MKAKVTTSAMVISARTRRTAKKRSITQASAGPTPRQRHRRHGRRRGEAVSGRLERRQLDRAGRARPWDSAGGRRSLSAGPTGLGGSPWSRIRPARRPPRMRNRRDQRLGVGMQRRAEDLVRRPLLDDPAKIHHRHAMADLAHGAEIMADEEHGHAEFRLQVGQEVDDLGLDRHVERRDRLVADDEVRPRRKRPGQHGALALPARELVRIARGVIGAEADGREQFGHPLHPLRRRAKAMDVERLADLLADGQAPVERGERILEDHLHAGAGAPSGRLMRQRQRRAVEGDRTGIRGLEADQETARGRLAAARLADQAEGFAATDRQRDAVDRMDGAGPAEEAAAHGIAANEPVRLE